MLAGLKRRQTRSCQLLVCLLASQPPTQGLLEGQAGMSWSETEEDKKYYIVTYTYMSFSLLYC